jgi:hypothetical protein
MSSYIHLQILQITYPVPFSLAISATTRWSFLRLFLRDWYGSYRFLGLELVIGFVPQVPMPLAIQMQEAWMREVGLLTP